MSRDVYMTNADFADSDGDRAHFNNMRGRLQALANIHAHLGSVLENLRMAHASVGAEVEELTDYVAPVHHVLHELARDNTPTLPFDLFLDRVLAQNREASSSASLDAREAVSRVLESEVRAHRLTMGHPPDVISLSAIGLAYEEDRLNTIEQCDSPGRVSRPTKQQAREEYIETANIMAEVLHALQGHEPAVLLRDVRNIPTLVAQNLESMTHLEELNQEINERIGQTVDNIEYLEGHASSSSAAEA
ncbi:hypothetical protein FKP32DRAFT_1677296 [Trametes sanguinea]|nr:hypothetical protein FKP32DRAFT_1677296 [Trametes sanguinea]